MWAETEVPTRFEMHPLLEEQASRLWPTMGGLVVELGDVLIEVRETSSDELGDRLCPEDTW